MKVVKYPNPHPPIKGGVLKYPLENLVTFGQLELILCIRMNRILQFIVFGFQSPKYREPLHPVRKGLQE